jgi:hypothetical protein
MTTTTLKEARAWLTKAIAGLPTPMSRRARKRALRSFEKQIIAKVIAERPFPPRLEPVPVDTTQAPRDPAYDNQARDLAQAKRDRKAARRSREALKQDPFHHFTVSQK